MRFLCLHGMGTSGRIFQAQLSPVTAMLGGEHEFVYIDGEVESEALVGKVFRLWSLHAWENN